MTKVIDPVLAAANYLDGNQQAEWLLQTQPPGGRCLPLRIPLWVGTGFMVFGHLCAERQQLLALAP